MLFSFSKIGSLFLYKYPETSLDIGFVVSIVSQLMHNPIEYHQSAMYKMLRYLGKILGK